MANELTFPDGLPLTLQFTKANVEPNTVTDLTLPGGGSGFTVPTGYEFHPMALNGGSNADLTAGTATFKVIAAGTELINGPTAGLADTVQAATGVKRPGVEPIAAGVIVGVSITTDANFAPNTADVDAVLVGVLLPA